MTIELMTIHDTLIGAAIGRIDAAISHLQAIIEEELERALTPRTRLLTEAYGKPVESRAIEIVRGYLETGAHDYDGDGFWSDITASEIEYRAMTIEECVTTEAFKVCFKNFTEKTVEEYLTEIEMDDRKESSGK